MTTRLHLVIPEQLRDELRRIAERRMLSVSDVVRLALVDAIRAQQAIDASPDQEDGA